MKTVEIYTDGACSYNPGPGGWAAILSFQGREKILSGGANPTTNNVMELTAVIRGLQALKEPCRVELYSDSNYVVQAINEGWLSGWAKNGWKSAANKPVKNVELWQELLPLLKTHKIEFLKVKGHAGVDKNERCDAIARQQVAKLSVD